MCVINNAVMRRAADAAPPRPATLHRAPAADLRSARAAEAEEEEEKLAKKKKRLQNTIKTRMKEKEGR